MANLKILDPVQGLVDYVLDVKPYHTKIVEVLVEYVHEDPVDVTILDRSEFVIDMDYPPGSIETIPCITGYDLGPFGDGGSLLITSPAKGISFQSYPAINTSTNSFTVNGNWADDILVGDEIFLNSNINTFGYAITVATPGVAGSGSFDIAEADIPPEFLITGYIFQVKGTTGNDGTYTVSGTVDNGASVTIQVDEAVADTSVGYIEVDVIVSTPGNHYGTFTVTSVEYNGGSIDSWPNISDPFSYITGESPHTIITVAESLGVPADFQVEPYQDYIVRVTPQVLTIESALSYSQTQRVLSPTFSQIPDEGINVNDIIGVVLSTVVVGVPVPDSGKITVSGDFGISNVFIGDALRIDASTDNDGTYTITSITYNSGLNETTFGVAELIDDATADGTTTIFIPANVLIVDGDRTSQFTVGKRIDVLGGSLDGTYTVLRSDFSQGKTRIRIAENIFTIGLGNQIASILGGNFEVRGDHTATYLAGVSFNVIGSPQNDGVYVVDTGGATYDSLLGLTTVPVDQTVYTVDSTAGGELQLALYGAIHHHVYGLAEVSPFCTHQVPELSKPFTATAYLTDTLLFAWGNELVDWFQYGIIEAQPEVLPTSSTLLIRGNAIGKIQINEEIIIIGTNVNDGKVFVSEAPTFDGVNTLVPVVNRVIDEGSDPRTYTEFALNYRTNAVVEYIDADTVKVLGNAANMLDGDDSIDIIGSTGNDGSYVVEGVSYIAPHSFVTIVGTFPGSVADGDMQFIERGGWVEPAHSTGINLRFEDTIGVSVSELVDAVASTTGGSMVGAFDYDYFDIGSFDEGSETVLHLYSNTF